MYGNNKRKKNMVEELLFQLIMKLVWFLSCKYLYDTYITAQLNVFWNLANKSDVFKPDVYKESHYGFEEKS